MLSNGNVQISFPKPLMARNGANIVGGNVMNTMSNMIQSSQNSFFWYVERRAMILTVKTAMATAPQLSPMIVMSAEWSRTSAPQAVEDAFCVVRSSLIVQVPEAQSVIC